MNYTDTLTKGENGKATISLVVEKDEFMKLWGKAVNTLKETVTLDGFRKGHVTEQAIVQKFGEMVVLEEMANIALKDSYIDIIKKHKIIPVTDPRITITKLAKDNPFEATLSVVLVPDVTLPDYKAVAKRTRSTEEISVTEEEITHVLTELRDAKDKPHSHDHHDHSGHDHDHDHSDHDHHHDHAHEHNEKTSPTVIDDAFAQSFGSQFATLDDLKAKIRENLTLEKKQKAREKERGAIIEALIKETSVVVPDEMVEDEQQRMLGMMKQDVTRFGGTWQEYLTHMKKTEVELMSSWKESAVSRVTSQLVLAKIAEKENLYATNEQIEVELVRLMAQVQDADEGRARDYLRQVLTNENVFAFLEGSEDKK